MTAADVRNVSMVLQGKYHSTSLSSNETHYITLSSAEGPQKLIDTLPTLRGPVDRDREGNGTPLQYFCLENPMDGGAW